MGDDATNHDNQTQLQKTMNGQQPFLTKQYVPNSPSLGGSLSVSGAAVAPAAAVLGSALDISSMMNMSGMGNNANNGLPTAASLSSSSNHSSSFAGRGMETGIVSHLRSPRQDIESTLKAKGGTYSSLHNIQNTVDGFSLNAGIGNFNNSFHNSNTVGNSMVSSSSPSLNAASVGGLNNNNTGQGLLVQGSNSNALQAALASGNPLVALLLQDQSNLEAALSQMASLNSNGMIMPSSAVPNPNMLLAARLGNSFGGNFSSQGSVLDPRLAGPFFNGSASSSKPKHKPLSLYMECDTDSLSEYQCLIRQQIELFAADKSEAASSVQGRNKQIVEGQVGIRCRHCAHVPSRQRQKGSMYFPTKLERIYQAAQNLSTFHLADTCKYVPDHVRKKILLLRERKSPAGGGKRYWGEGVRCLGVTEKDSGLRFR
ncbi:MAG: hypothetical protein SGARI_000074 [Bacillariaceae sp.]